METTNTLKLWALPEDPDKPTWIRWLLEILGIERFCYSLQGSRNKFGGGHVFVVGPDIDDFAQTACERPLELTRRQVEEIARRYVDLDRGHRTVYIQPKTPNNGFKELTIQ